METESFEISSNSEEHHNPIRIEIQPDNGGHHNTIHTIQLQSPGGSSHFVEGLVVTTSSQQLPSSDNHITLAHGNNLMIENHNDYQSIQNGSITVTEGTGEQILCGAGIQVVGLATNENGETIFLLPKQESPVVVLGSETDNLVTSEEIIEQITSTPPVIIRNPPSSIAAPSVQSASNRVTSQPTLIVVASENHEVQEKANANIGEAHDERPKRKAALKAIAARKAAKKRRENYGAAKAQLNREEGSIEDFDSSSQTEDVMEDNGQENEDSASKAFFSPTKDSSEASQSKIDFDDSVSTDDDDDENKFRRCIVCLRRQRFTEDIFDSSKQLYYHIDVLIAHLNIQVKGTPVNTGICPECMNYLQRWHVFNCAIVKRHEQAKSLGVRVIDDPISYQSFESRVYKNFKKIAKVKEVYDAATHGHYARRHLTEKDWDYFCDHLFHSNSVKSEKSRELEKFLTSKEKLSHMYCITCQKLISGGKKGFMRHMQVVHKQAPVMFPCDVCGRTFPEKDMTASTEDYYPHWISHFYFNRCTDCGKTFPTKRALGQHRHAVHKNRQVKCDKCGKVLANKMSLDLHLLRHLPETEKKKYMIKCKICKKKIAQWNLKSHMATHNDERPWKCDHCEASFKMKGALVSHRDVVHFNLKNHVCPICGDAFKSASSLRGHVRRHEGRKDYKCEVCHKEYYTYSALKGHKVVHQTARDFICTACGKAFKKRKALEEHATIHTGEKPHRCPICGREVRVKSNLYKHMKIHKKNPNGTIPTKRKANASGSKSSPESLEPSVNDINGSIVTESEKPDENGTMTWKIILL